MGIVLFTSVFLACFLISYTYLAPKKLRFIVSLIISLILGYFIKTIGTYTGCADGWMSTNIGKQGACSHHGGVVTYLNLYGYVSLTICTILIVVFFLVEYIKFKKRQDIRMREISEQRNSDLF